MRYDIDWKTWNLAFHGVRGRAWFQMEAYSARSGIGGDGYTLEIDRTKGK